MPHDRDAAARIARQLIQAAGPPDESNAEVYAFVEAMATAHSITAGELVKDH